MTTTTIPVPSGEEMAATFAVLGDEDLVHVERPCRPDVALCGAPILEFDYVLLDVAESPECAECVAVERASEAEHRAVCEVCRVTGW